MHVHNIDIFQMVSKDSSTTGLEREESSVPQVDVQVHAHVPVS